MSSIQDVIEIAKKAAIAEYQVKLLKLALITKNSIIIEFVHEIVTEDK